LRYLFHAMKETPATTSVIVSFGNKVPVFTMPAYELTPEFMQAQVLRLQVNAAIEDMVFDEMNSAQVVNRK